ncbi:hypothetical protein [Streptomyces sp. NPDC050738]|uniref:hypothetical protein n=1 Tax=Streptomyces sp. NPDC050738 TaxID=3154744 RepID=UPI003416C065
MIDQDWDDDTRYHSAVRRTRVTMVIALGVAVAVIGIGVAAALGAVGFALLVDAYAAVRGG